MKQYGLSSYDLKYARDKRDVQLSYLSNNHFHTSTGQVKSLLDVSFSANLSERYYSQLSNKINTMHSLAITQGLSPVFLTITLDGFFRGSLTANYKKWDRFTDVQKFEYNRHIPNNDQWGYVRDKMAAGQKLTIKDLYNVLAFQWYRFAAGYSFKRLKKDGCQFIYLKAAEPHKDGVPHFHVLLWIPEKYFGTFKKDFARYFPAPRNHKPTKDDEPDCDTHGFQTAIHNPVGYIMKYATKSFMDLRTGEDMNYLQAWYIKHKIRRITTSHSTIPQWVYQKCYLIEKDWYHLTDLNIRDPLLCEWDREKDYFLLIEQSGRSIEYDRGYLRLYYLGGPVIKEYGELKETPARSPRKFEPVPPAWIDPHPKSKYIDVFIEDDHYLYRDGEIFKPTPTPMKMSDLELYEYWNSLDLETVNPHHFAHTQNEMIRRNFLTGDMIPLENDLEFILWGFSDDF